ncbi:MAG TPA: hypothetical protein VE442_04365, partial [Jatrophihabitans sp.]|nr:hypothetical protein [Jatrophihabitans sp.]
LFGPVPTIIGAGSRVLWLQTRAASGALGCVSASTGRLEQQWRLPGVLAATSSSGDGALVATRSDVLGLIMNGCQG